MDKCAFILKLLSSHYIHFDCRTDTFNVGAKLSCKVKHLRCAQVPSHQCTGQTAWLAGWQPVMQQACPAAPSSACLQPWVMQSRSGSGTFGACPRMTSHQRMPLLWTRAADGPCALTLRCLGAEPHVHSSCSLRVLGKFLHSQAALRRVLGRQNCHIVHQLKHICH